MRNKLVTCLALSTLLAAGPALAQRSPACKPVLDAMIKSAITDHRIDSRSNDTSGQLIAAGGAIYVSRNGKWAKSPMTMAQQQAQEKENIANAKVYNCTPTTAVAGATGMAYKIHTESEDGDVTEGVMVIGANGLPVLGDYTIGSDGEKRHYVNRYSYDNIHAPL